MIYETLSQNKKYLLLNLLLFDLLAGSMCVYAYVYVCLHPTNMDLQIKLMVNKLFFV